METPDTITNTIKGHNNCSIVVGEMRDNNTINITTACPGCLKSLAIIDRQQRKIEALSKKLLKLEKKLLTLNT